MLRALINLDKMKDKIVMKYFLILTDGNREHLLRGI
ncbi:hypothetical protein C5S32_01060 [ANME-1 cluster archaeon GoMg1]|nr:hypothetical protein [ANME-1 cluster archaeon GoMg1]